MGYAIELLNGGTLHCGFWHYPIGKDEESKDSDLPTSQPLNAKKKPVLVFADRGEAKVALDFYEMFFGECHISAQVKQVDADPTHRLTNDGFKAVEMGADTLFG